MFNQADCKIFESDVINCILAIAEMAQTDVLCSPSTKTNIREKENQGNFGIPLDQSALNNISSK